MPLLKSLLEKAGTHQGGGGDKLGAGIHFQGMRGAGITEAHCEHCPCSLSDIFNSIKEALENLNGPESRVTDLKS